MSITDYAERRGAILTESHAFVQASAGTGKTHTLTLRAFFLLCRFGGTALFSPSRSKRMSTAREAVRSLVLTTFTRKAAAEMQTRLYRYLDFIVAAPDCEALRTEESLQWDSLFLEIVEYLVDHFCSGSFDVFRAGIECLAELASEMNITTLHGYSAGILKRHPVESAIPPWCRFAEEDEDDLSDFEDRLVDRWWQTEAVTNPVIKELFDEVLREISLDQLRNWFKLVARAPSLCRRLDQFPSLPEQRAERVIQALQWLACTLQGLKGAKLVRTGRELEDLVLPDPGPASWRQICGFLDRNQKYLFTGKTKSLNAALAEAPAPIRDELDDYYALYGTALSKVLSTELAAAWEAWTRLVTDFAEWQRSARLNDLGLLTFDDMITRCVELLRNHDAVRKAEHRRIRALLVDEFQDTDRAQLQLLSLLLAKQPGDNHEPIGFFVGDSKQSIYRFRGADVPSVNRFRERYQSLIGIESPPRMFQLQTSFRSSDQLIEFTNRLFSDDIPLATDTEQLVPFHGPGKGPPEILVPVKDPEIEVHSAGASREMSVNALLSVVSEWMEGPRRKFKDIMILTRSNHELDLILPAMLHAGVPVVASGAKTFYRHPEVLDLLNLLIALHHPDDSLATAATLRAPLFNLTDDQIDRILREMTAPAIFHGPAEVPKWFPQAESEKIAELRRLVTERHSTYLPDWLIEVRRHFPMTSYTDPRDCEGRALARVDKVLTSFQKVRLSGSNPPIVWLVQQRQRAAEADRWDAEMGEDVALTDETVDAVRALTVHKAKGLEAPLVILFDWGGLMRSTQSPRLESPPLLAAPSRSERLGLEFKLPWGDLSILSPGYPEALEREQEECRKEAWNLAYVAATRARDHAVLLVPPRKEARFAIDHATGASERGIVTLRCQSFEKLHIQTAAPDRRDLDRGEHASLWNSRKEPTDRKITYHPSHLEDDRDQPPSLEKRPVSSSDPGLGSQVGRLVHRYLECHLEASSLDRSSLEGLAVELGLEKSGPEVSNAAGILERFLAGETVDGAGYPLITRIRNGQILARELPVFLTFQGKAWSGVIDLILSEGAKTTGIDYKTGSAEGNLGRIYAQQKTIYREALSRSLPGADVAFEFWWLGSS